MADALKLAFVLSATDKMSRVISEAVNKSTGKLTAFERNTSRVGKSMMTAGGVMMGAGVGIGSALVGVGQASADYAGSVNDMSEATGVSIQAWQEMAFAAKMSGIEQEKLATSLVKFDKQIASAAAGSKTAGQAFSDLGISLKDSEGNIRKPNEIFKDVAEIFSKVENGAAKTALACDLFGKSGAELMPMLNEGKEGLSKLYDAAKKTSNVLSDEAIRACDTYGKKVDAIKLQTKGAGLALGATLAPMLLEVANKLSIVIQRVTDWIMNNQELVTMVGKFAGVVAALLTGLGAASAVIGGVVFVVGKFVSVWRKVMTVVRLGKALFTLVQESMLLFRVQYAALVVWQKLAAAAQWLFNSSLMGCPIVWIIAAVIAIGAAVYLLIKHWDKVSAFFRKLWEDVKNIFSSVWNWIKQMFLNYTAIGLVIKHWDTITAWFVGLWGGVKMVFASVWNWIKQMFLNYTPQGLIIKHWDTIAAWFGRLWDSVKGIFSSAWEGIKNVFASLNPLEWFNSMWGDVTAFFTELPAQFFNFGRNIINGLTGGIKSLATSAWESVTGIGEGIKNKFKSFFGINSPSTLFAEYGLNITQGLTGGLKKGTPAVTDTTEGLAVQATRNIGSEIAATGTSGNTVNNAGGVSLNYAPVINIQGNATPEAKAEFLQLLRAHRDEIIKIIRQHTENKQRLAFS